ncbi:uncharacterized protein LOC113855967 [Abrus precatorius]|uniref:Uncharacterized protein LOC113855967 n=1 Tax=Abrus precatorius TaxID=3816 RepID=A0A8B8KHZ5_ABRPR|nr:uncharacterized protein LOC113855967 [Abrus precatorius]
MFSESGSFRFMGVSSNSKVFLSDKDPKANMDQELGFLVRHTSEIHKEECQTSTYKDHRRKQVPVVQERDQQEDEDYHQEEQKQRNDISKPLALASLTLKVEIPSCGVSEDDDSNEGFKTPTSSDHKIPVILECPGAPRKRPPTKRKACDRRIVRDLCKELESLFPTPSVVDLDGGSVNKRVKQCLLGTDSKTWQHGEL